MTLPATTLPRKQSRPRPDDPILDDLLESGGDIGALARRHGMTLVELGEWADSDRTRRTLARLCRLADSHAQVAVSRFRVHAASRLAAHATSAGGDLSHEQVRKACVDLLKTQVVPQDVLAQDAAIEDEGALRSLEAVMQQTGE